MATIAFPAVQGRYHPTVALGSLMWGMVLALAGVVAWSVGSVAAWAVFALLLAIFALMVAAVQRARWTSLARAGVHSTRPQPFARSWDALRDGAGAVGCGASGCGSTVDLTDQSRARNAWREP
jgi:hypothetical protein